MSFHEIMFAHELDAAWIVALWLAIHGGDPAPESVAAQVIAAVAPYLSGAQSSPSFPESSFSEVQAQYSNLSIHATESSIQDRVLTVDDMPAAISTEQPFVYCHRQYCFQFAGETICTDLPILSYRETAA